MNDIIAVNGENAEAAGHRRNLSIDRYAFQLHCIILHVYCQEHIYKMYKIWSDIVNHIHVCVYNKLNI